MAFRLHNTMTGKKEPFTPLDPKRVTMYVCGPTVYNFAHIGNARPPVVFDVLNRLLRHLYGADHVIYARNITDVDDKIIKSAKETGQDISAITKKYADIYRADMAALGVIPPDIEPHATENIPEMLSVIRRLIDGGNAYEAEGHVLFSIASFDDYGALARVNRDEMIAGARVEVAPYKKDPADFVLWKPAKDDEPGWDSDFGRGRPGWHLECSAMIEKTLGDTIDIHGGGQDLRFPHHENEIAQSACVHEGAPLANFWIHNGFVNMGGDKMSKSEGNVILVNELVKQYDAEVLRWALLSAHYRQPLAWTTDLLVQSKNCLDRLYGYLRGLDDVDVAEDAVAPDAVLSALMDDLNTPEAISAVFAVGKALGEAKSDKDKAAAKGTLLAAGGLLGLFTHDPEDWFQSTPTQHRSVGAKISLKVGVRGQVEVGYSKEAIDKLVEERAEARAAKDFARSDQIRDELAAQGIIIEDGPDGAKWRRG